MQHADRALYVAKEQGKIGYCFFTSEIERRAAERVTMEMHLRDALARACAQAGAEVVLVSGPVIGHATWHAYRHIVPRPA